MNMFLISFAVCTNIVDRKFDKLAREKVEEYKKEIDEYNQTQRRERDEWKMYHPY